MVQIEVINIGSELLDGTRVNTNLISLADYFNKLDITINRGVIIGDDEEEILEAIRDSFNRVNVVITTGGLGPTLDDMTKKVITRFFKRRLVVDNSILKNIEDFYKKVNISPPQFVYNQALVPQGSKVLPNLKGTAPGLIVEENNKVLIALPGVPEELSYLMEKEVILYLSRRVKSSANITYAFRIYGLSEAEISQKLDDILKRNEFKFSFLPRQNEVILKIEAKGKKATDLIGEVEASIRKILGDAIYGVGEETLEGVVALLLSMGKKKIAVAESCTGGLISHRLTNIPGSSNYFERAFITYSNRAKIDMLGIDERILKEKGAVSQEMAEAMALGAREKAKVELGLAVTGIAGPGGGSSDKPVGLVFISLATPEKVITREFHFEGERELIKNKVSQAALNMVRLTLIKNE